MYRVLREGAVAVALVVQDLVAEFADHQQVGELLGGSVHIGEPGGAGARGHLDRGGETAVSPGKVDLDQAGGIVGGCQDGQVGFVVVVEILGQDLDRVSPREALVGQ